MSTSLPLRRAGIRSNALHKSGQQVTVIEDGLHSQPYEVGCCACFIGHIVFEGRRGKGRILVGTTGAELGGGSELEL